ncbi:MAG: TolC family protein [Verrucomicrobia bacterium]|jgi:outer membrane protein, heavy metal efflux system|nr:TolC family protein [Verrucomicrobiota bacterium]
MKKLAISSALSALLLATSVSDAQEQKRDGTDKRDTQSNPAVELDSESPPEDYLRHAALNNSGLKAAFNRWKAAVERIPQAKSLPDPRFNYTYYMEEVETRVGPQRQKFGIVQMFPWFGKLRLKGDAMAEAAAAAQQEYEKTKLALFRSVKTAYYEYWYLAQAIAVTKEHISLVGNIEGVARTRFKTGAAANSSVVQAQVELGKLDDRLRSLEALRRPIVAKLNAALSRSTHLPLPWPHSIPDVAASFTDEEAMQWLAASSPELRRLDHLVLKEEAGNKLAKRDYYPDISLGIDYVDTDDALTAGTPDSGKDPVMAMVSVNVPIWFGKYRAAERESHLRMSAAQQEREDSGKRLEAELELALYHFRNAERKIDLYGDTLVPKAQQSLSVAQQGFQAGKTGFISLIDAQRILLEFQLAEHRARADRGQRLADVEMLIGKETETGNRNQT